MDERERARARANAGMETMSAVPGDAPVAEHERALAPLEALASRAERDGELETAVDVAHAVLARERELAGRASSEAYASALDRILTSNLLDAVAARLADDPERYHVHVDLLDRAGEAGAAAVVGCMTEAQGIAERRLYFDLLHVLDGALPVLLRMLRDGRWFVVRNACDLLGLMEATEAIPALSGLAVHPDGRVRRAAALALAKIGTPPAQERARAALAAAGVEEESAATAFITGEHPGVPGVLIEALEQERDEDQRKVILIALGRTGTRSAIERLTKVARGADTVVGRAVPLRIAAVRALGEAGTAEAVVALRSLLHDPEAQVRGAALWAVCGEGGGLITER
jgi:HEAT repeat protein